MLTVNGLEVVYHRVLKVLSGISLQVPDRGCVALLGPNGAGKTTVLRAITGLLALHNGDITKGTVTLAGQRLNAMSPERIVRTGIAQVMEGRRIFASLTVEENLIAGTVSPGAAAAHGIDEMFERFPRLAERRRQTAGLLSGGEQQMLAVARALLTRPKVLLLDEPSLGLAPQMVEQIAALIRETREAGVAVLLVEQNAQMALGISDHGYIMENGRIVLDGPSADLLNDPDVQEFYLGTGGETRKSYREIKRYARRKRWLS